MPRVTILKKRYNERDLIAWIYTRAREKKLTLEELARAIGITRQTLHNKMQEGRVAFTYPELMELFKKLGATDAEILHFMRA